MRSALLALLALSVACGKDAAPPGPPSPQRNLPKDPYADSPLVGRWSGGARTLEFIADGTLVDLVEFEAERSTRLPDGTFEKETVKMFDCHVGSFRVAGDRVEYALAKVGSDQGVEGAWTWSIEGTTLALEQGGEREEFLRDDPDVSPAARPLLGLWRRVGSMGSDFMDLGVTFTPGGLSIVVGKSAFWEQGAMSSIGWFCSFATYEVEGEQLHEVRPNVPDRPRSRAFKLEGDRLTFDPKRTYERVRGVVPVKGTKLDLDAWKAMK